MPTCPNGHQSGSDDWCEVCGHRMAGPGAPSGAVPPPPPPPPSYGYPGPGGDPNATAQAELCPQCRTPREAMAPFCEECRYNFLTNTATSYTPAAPPQPGLNLPPGFQSQPGPPAPPPHQVPPPHQGPPPPPPQQGPPPHEGPPRPPQQRDPFEYQGSRPSQMNRPAEPLGQEPSGPQQPPQAFQQGGPPPAFQQSGPPAPPAPPQHTGGGDDWMLSPPSRTQSPPPPAPQGPQAPRHQGPQAPQAPQHQAPQHQSRQGPQGPPPFQQQGGQPPQFPGRPAQAGWTAVIGPDREYFMAMMQRSGPEATGLNLPAYSPEQRLPLTGTQVTIGRRRHSTGESPDIDLSVPPEDPGVSHQHAVLVQQPDGSWAVVDQNSTNGTTLNGAEDPIQPYVPIPLNDGDRVHVGAWTTITVRRG
ncbi:FHA domain-containing protein [Streptomyces sp. ISL-10]|uniref:FHA domain-containing protein n=1 Tax=Streptomyces sp. ISL-10 TaxID=2819172 RepID=UPI001BEC3595|nr:FHA domain-containing protein [Streptomyces sp. ISL-10]MBT2368424.1 FHA domain-containing protein [Streptomyces sp. ISL-10]